MKNLFLGLSLAVTALLAACSSGSGTNSEPLEFSSNSSSGADLFAETFDDLPVCTVNREGAIAYVKDEKAAHICENGDWTLDDENTTERRSNGDTGNGGSNDASVYDADKNTLKDLRDGQVYKTTTIDIPSKSYSEVWMAENLNYAYTGIPFDNGYTSDSTSWCYGDDPAYCAKYGRLYTWAAAMDSVGEWSTNGKGCGYGKTCSVASAGSATLVRGICPKGWHLPSNDEWNALFTAVRDSSGEGTKLKSATGWIISSGNGTDTFGFSALPAGYRGYGGKAYGNEGYNADFWSSTEVNSGYAYNMELYYITVSVFLHDNYKYNGYSVRCLKD
jgi:uncharacterized protein (TIGR02145 family)